MTEQTDPTILQIVLAAAGPRAPGRRALAGVREGSEFRGCVGPRCRLGSILDQVLGPGQKVLRLHDG